jgi:hypothetical protein
MNFQGFGVMHTFDNYFLCTFPQVQLTDIDHVVMDTMALIDLYNFFEKSSSDQYVTPGVLDLLRNTDLHVTTSAIERAWMHETNSSKSIEHFLKPKGSVIADTIEMLDFIKNCKAPEFALLKNEKFGIEDIPKIQENRTKESLAYGLENIEFISTISQNWLGIATLMALEPMRPSSLNGDEDDEKARHLVLQQIDSYKSWQTQLRAYGVGISTDLRLMANLFFFGGYIDGIHGNKVRYEELAKFNERGKHLKSRLARNIAFDFQHLTNARQFRMGWLNNSVRVENKFSAILTRDNILAAMVGNVFEEKRWTDQSKTKILGIEAPYKWPQESDFTKVFPENFAYEGFYGKSRSSHDLLEAIDLVPILGKVLKDLDLPLEST